MAAIRPRALTAMPWSLAHARTSPPLVLVLLGPALNLSLWVIDDSPLGRSPKLLSTTVAAAPLIWLTAVAAALAVAGLAGLRRRDIG